MLGDRDRDVLSVAVRSSLVNYSTELSKNMFRMIVSNDKTQKKAHKDRMLSNVRLLCSVRMCHDHGSRYVGKPTVDRELARKREREREKVRVQVLFSFHLLSVFARRPSIDGASRLIQGDCTIPIPSVQRTFS